MDAAVVLPRLLLQLNAHPFAVLEARGAHVANDGLAAIGELDRLSTLEIGHYGQLSRS